MPPMGHLKDEEIADILTYVRSSWGNEANPISAAEVAAVRAKISH
jgi:mono/diheme cytochrome c family protein